VIMRFHARWLMLVAALFVAACGDSPTSPDADDVTNLERIDLIPGTGAEATNTSRITVHYTGYLYEEELADHRGAQFETTRGGLPVAFELSGNLIAGWKQGIPGMRVGGQRRLIIPSRLGYGPNGSAPKIPPNSALVFDIELVSIP
jgi:FKBP-type peptidyl-prolyl cis-trans isomerase FkpA